MNDLYLGSFQRKKNDLAFSKEKDISIKKTSLKDLISPDCQEIICTNCQDLFSYLNKKYLMNENLRNLNVISISTILFGILLWIADKKSKSEFSQDSVSAKDAFYIGLAQCLALIPGTSRSAVTIICALFLSYSRTAASKFAFMLAIPTLGVIFLFELTNLSLINSPESWRNIFLITFLSFISSYLCISLFLRLIEKIGFTPFVLYRLFLGSLLFLV